MHIYLNPPRTLWGIPKTDILLTRSSPFYEILDEELERLTKDQKQVLVLAKELNVITEINPDFIPPNAKKVGIDYIVTLPVSDIQRQYVSRFILTKDMKSLKELVVAEEAKSRPRQSVFGVSQ